jgi:hypothetical protein
MALLRRAVATLFPLVALAVLWAERQRIASLVRSIRAANGPAEAPPVRREGIRVTALPRFVGSSFRGEASRGEAGLPAGAGFAGSSMATAQAGEVPDGAVVGDGSPTCAEGYPVKANPASGIYHLPGQVGYDRLAAGLCFASAELAEGAG